jgi:uncharacterized protein YjiS (DUF1127 family)
MAPNAGFRSSGKPCPNNEQETAMTAIATSRTAPTAPLARLAAAVLDRVAVAMKHLVLWRQNRRDAAVLARADDRMLADIGLSRSDVFDALSGSPWNDPTALLRVRALERRLSRRHVSLGLSAESAPPLAPHDQFCQTPARGI